MTWYYALGNERQGPVDDAELDRLIASGVVTSDTLVWRAGMADWQPLSQARPRVAPPPPAPSPGSDVTRVIPAAGTPASRATDPATQPRGVQTPAFGQTPSFGMPGAGAAAPGASAPGAEPFEDADEIYARITATGRTFSIGDVVNRGWQLVSARFGLTVGVSALVLIALIVASIIPCIGGILQLLIQGPLFAGLYIFFLKLHRGREAQLDDAFSGFNFFLPLLLNAIVQAVISFVAAIPGLILFLIGGSLGERSEAAGVLFIAIGALVMFIPLMYLGVSWAFSVPLIADKGLSFWAAMELSRKVVQRQFFSVLGLVLVQACIVIAGFLALCLGIFVALPVCFASMAAAYEDLFGNAPAR